MGNRYKRRAKTVKSNKDRFEALAQAVGRDLRTLHGLIASQQIVIDELVAHLGCEPQLVERLKARGEAERAAQAQAAAERASAAASAGEGEGAATTPDARGDELGAPHDGSESAPAAEPSAEAPASEAPGPVSAETPNAEVTGAA